MPPNYFITTSLSFSHSNLTYLQVTITMTYNTGRDITIFFLICDLQNVFCRRVNMVIRLNVLVTHRVRGYQLCLTDGVNQSVNSEFAYYHL